ncbi:MAG: thioredoxin domain-containing protein [Candidatus Marinimicrobia bacterium]|nr:thioredoxin domain-containing protein [Candidatus Neomarinimicrobiota bacterium]
MADSVEHTNRLVESTSPYLLQHAHNPVDWYPWSKEALDLAKERQIPILLSIGYSACHWCHVMEKESFENEQTAELMNSSFVNIKVDREERPDIDETYMAATQAMNRGQGGWPMTVFLTPELKPFFTGTYFPPQDAYGRPGFPTILQRIAELWETKRTDLLSQADSIVKHLNTSVSQSSSIDDTVNQRAIESWKSSHDKIWGGFGPAPKFPNSGAILHLLYDYVINGNEESLEPAVKTLDAMYEGGIYDHIGGGFARYSVDEKWLVPHFEKMLYDNAQLMEAYLVGYQVTENPEYLKVIEQIFEWLNDEMIDPNGGFYSSMDADSEGVEGKYYVWTKSEIKKILPEKEAKIFCQYYDITDGGNWEGTSIPHLILKKDSICNILKISEKELTTSLEKSRQIVKQHRSSRIPPGTDDKIIVSWNGLMISALAKASYVLGKPEYFEAASKSTSFILDRMSKKDGTLYRTYRNDLAHIDAFAEDYSFFGNSLIDMYESSFDPFYLGQSRRFADILVRNFLEKGNFRQSLSKNIVINQRNSMDNATPSYNFRCCLLLIRLYFYFNAKEYKEIVEKTLQNHGKLIKEHPFAHSTALFVYNYLSKSPLEVAIIAKNSKNSLSEVLKGHLLPYKIVASSVSGLDISLITDKKMLKNAPTAYICKDYVCKNPITDPEVLDQALKSHFK